MFRLCWMLILVTEVVALALLALLAPGVPVLPLVPIVGLTLIGALLARRWLQSAHYRLRQLSPEAITGYRPRRPATDTPEGLSCSIVERAEEIRRALEEDPPDEVRVEMCALGYRACANDMITLTHLTNETLPNASLLQRVRLRRARRKAIDALTGARKALPPGALRAAPQERQ